MDSESNDPTSSQQPLSQSVFPLESSAGAEKQRKARVLARPVQHWTPEQKYYIIQKYQEMREGHTRDTFVTAVQQLGVKEGMWDVDRVINRNILQSMLNWAREQSAKKAGGAPAALASPPADSEIKKRKLVESTGPETLSQSPAPAEVVVSPAYEVESIVSRKLNADTGKIEYLIKWKGFSPDQNTWEPAEHLIGCSDMLARFNAGIFSGDSPNIDAQLINPSEMIPHAISLPPISTISTLPPLLPIPICPTPTPSAPPPAKPKNTTKSDLSRLRSKMRELMGYVMKQSIPPGPDVDLLFCAWVDDTLSKVKESTPS